VPNFGFVVFEDENAAQEALKGRPIYLPPDNHRLNVEEKKNRVSWQRRYLTGIRSVLVLSTFEILLKIRWFVKYEVTFDFC
jgi:hypothetical protein